LQKGFTLNDLELMELHTAALFNHDAQGRITGTNDGEPPGIAPRLYLGRTLDGNIWRFRDDVPDTFAAELTSILESEPNAADLRRPPETLTRLRDSLRRLGPIESVSIGPAFQFPSEIPVSGGVSTVNLSEIGIVKEHFPDHFPWLASEFEIRRPITAVVRDGVAVSICFCARLTPEAAEAGVDTAEAYRGRGFAARVVSVWAAEVQHSGRIPMYSTSWDNVASQRVADKLGLILYGAELSIS
jgi:GNAT acetyltransferase